MVKFQWCGRGTGLVNGLVVVQRVGDSSMSKSEIFCAMLGVAERSLLTNACNLVSFFTLKTEDIRDIIQENFFLRGT